MYRSYENIDIFHPLKLTPQWVHWKNYINNVLTLVIWKCVYDRIIYIVKKYQYFFKTLVFKGGTMLPRGWDTDKMLSYVPEFSYFRFCWFQSEFLNWIIMFVLLLLILLRRRSVQTLAEVHILRQEEVQEYGLDKLRGLNTRSKRYERMSENKFSCSLCSFQTQRKSHLNKHLLVHQGTKSQQL